MEAEKIIEMMIAEGKISREEIDGMIAAEKEKSPLLPIQSAVDGLKEANDVAIFAVADAYENQIISDLQRQEEAAVNMNATAEIFEYIMFLEMRLSALEGGE